VETLFQEKGKMPEVFLLQLLDVTFEPCTFLTRSSIASLTHFWSLGLLQA